MSEEDLGPDRRESWRRIRVGLTGLAGILLLAMALPAMAGSIELAITDGLDMARRLAGG